MKLCAWSLTDTGLRREANEDNLLVAPELGLYAVADGMGGHNGGARASELALEVLRESVASAHGDLATAASQLASSRQRRWRDDLDDRESSRITEELDVSGRGRAATLDGDDGELSAASALMRLAILKASSAVFAAAEEDPTLRGMGTTLTGMLYDSGRMHLVHAGDSRAYLFRDGRLVQLTEDHSWITEQLKSGAMTEEEAKASQFRHVITRSVGFERDVEVDVGGIAVEPGDCFLLCSDGLSNYVEEYELEELMAESWYRLLPARLVDLANGRGGDDNITVVVVYAANEVR